MTSVLFVCEGNQKQSDFARKKRFGYWSAGTPVLLEKWGFLNFVINMSPEILNQSDISSYDIILVGRLTDKDVAEHVIRLIKHSSKASFIEGPLPEGIVLGNSDVELGKITIIQNDTNLYIDDQELSAELNASCPETYNNENNAAPLSIKSVKTHQKEFDHITARHQVKQAQSLSEIVSNLAITYLYVINNKYQKDGKIANTDDHNIIALRSLVIANQKLGEGIHCDRMRGKIKIILESSINNYKTNMTELHPDNNNEQDVTKTAEKYQLLFRTTEFENLANNLANEILEEWSDDPQKCWREILYGNPLSRIIYSISILKSKNQTIAEKLLLWLVDRLYEPKHAGFYQPVDNQLTLTPGDKYSQSPWIWLAVIEMTDSIAMPHTASRIQESYHPEHIQLWSSSPLERQDQSLLAQYALVKYEDGTPAISLISNCIITSFPILAYLVHYHTNEPLAEPYLELTSLSYQTIEKLMYLLLIRLIRLSAIPIPIVMPWPGDNKYCLTIRHDVDRIPSEKQKQQLLDYHSSHNLGVTWYWLPWRHDHLLINAANKLGHEMALHSVRIDNKTSEMRQVQAACGENIAIIGEAFHGSASDGWLGIPSVEASIAAGLEYCEFMPDARGSPYAGFPVISEAGEVSVRRGSIGITRTDSTDHLSDVATIHDKVRNKNLVADWIRQGGHINLLNHPDINFEKLKNYIEILPSANRCDWTNSQVASWWAKTHNHDMLQIQREYLIENTIKYIIYSRSDINDLAVKFCTPYKKRIIKIYRDSNEINTASNQVNGDVTLFLDVIAERENSIYLKYESYDL